MADEKVEVAETPSKEEVEKAKAEIAEEVRYIFLKLVHDCCNNKSTPLYTNSCQFMLTIAIIHWMLGIFPGAWRRCRTRG